MYLIYGCNDFIMRTEKDEMVADSFARRNEDGYQDMNRNGIELDDTMKSTYPAGMGKRNGLIQ